METENKHAYKYLSYFIHHTDHSQTLKNRVGFKKNLRLEKDKYAKHPKHEKLFQTKKNIAWLVEATF